MATVALPSTGGATVPQFRVELPAAAPGQAVSFKLPAGALTTNPASATAAAPAQALMADGNPLPSWIKFDAATQTFTVTEIPSGAQTSLALKFLGADGSVAAEAKLELAKP